MTGLLDTRISHQEFKEAHQDRFLSVLEMFSRLNSEEILLVSIGFLSPSQTPDDVDNYNTTTPLEAFIDGGKIIIQNGNHRFWTRVRKGECDLEVPVKKRNNPYFNY